jgi:adsorption protein B
MYLVIALALPVVAAYYFASTWPWLFGSLATALLVSGIDDLIPLVICCIRWVTVLVRGPQVPTHPLDLNERRIAIFVPCWKESAVIGNMVRHNLTAIRYQNFDFFLGVYPNDQPTVAVATHLSQSYPNVHAAVCPHPGPTSKADCLNWVYRRMIDFEMQHDVRFDTIVMHDAEDLIHPEALPLINRERETYAMVQVPVLPLPTPPLEITHGIYCDEFAEFQTLDMHARQFSGSFVPSNGVGTGFAREILERLASEREEVFDSASLTEDYEIGIYIHAAGYRQLFAPLTRVNNEFIATREYFPRTVNTAIRQRTRWVTGIALQCWERRGWGGSWRTRYWFWRDRKGLVANPLSLLTNLLFMAGLTDFVLSVANDRPWAFAVNNPRIAFLCFLTMSLQCVRLALRMFCVGRIFGHKFALGVPVRSFHANLINCFAALRAMWRYAHAKHEKRVLVWQKTEHHYPTGNNLSQPRRDFAEVLVSGGFMTAEQIADIRADLSPYADFEEFFLRREFLSDADLCRVISLQTGVPLSRIDVARVKQQVARSLPTHVERRHGVVPVDIQAGRLVIAGRRVPSPQALEEIKSFTFLNVDFQLVTLQNYLELRQLL